MRFGSLFAGIGGFDLGLERAGMTCDWQVEIDPYATKVLEKHWPNVRRWADVRTFPPPEGEWGVDLICGGFPCQDISYAGKGAGLAGERSGLWYEYARVIGALRPRYVVVENVAALLTRGMGEVLGKLASLGYDAEWHVIPASAVGAPHRRDRVWIVAHADRGCLHRIDADAGDGGTISQEEPQRIVRGGNGGDYVSDADGERTTLRRDSSAGKEAVAGRRGDSGRGERDSGPRCAGRTREGSGDVADAGGIGPQRVAEARPATGAAFGGGGGGGWWATEPNVGRVAHGVPHALDRLRCLGNAVVPQVVELIGRAIMEHDRRTAAVWEEVATDAAAK